MISFKAILDASLSPQAVFAQEMSKGIVHQ